MRTAKILIDSISPPIKGLDGLLSHIYHTKHKPGAPNQNLQFGKMGWIGPGNAESIALQIKSLKYLSKTIFLFFFVFDLKKFTIVSIVYLGSLSWNPQVHEFKTLYAPVTSRILRPYK